METMNKLISRLMMIAIIISAISFTSCEKDPDPVDESKVLIEYLESTIDPISWGGVLKTAETVHTDNVTGDVYIIDIRTATEFTDGHITNAVNVPAGQLLAHVESTDLSDYDYVALVCVSGQTAAWAATLLRLAGHEDTWAMKFGMCSWNAHFANAWNNARSSQYWPDYVTTATDKSAEGSLPTLSTGMTTAEDILANRINAVFTEGFGTGAITSANLMDDPSKYYVVNYWPSDYYSDPGHINGAVQYTPSATLTLATDLKTLPTDKTIVVYCYSGQTSAYVIAYLRTIGYDALTCKYGTNSMIYDHMPKSKWTEGAIMGYDYVGM